MKYFTENKKSILISIGFLFFTGQLKAQEPAYARQLFEEKSFAAAKQSADSFVQNNPGNAAGWLLKARIYNAISKDQSLKDMVADGRMDAFLALQKAVQLNKQYTEREISFSLPFDLYNGYTNEGLQYFNAGVDGNNKNNFTTALDKFKKAAMVSRWIYSNGWGLTSFDTANIYYSARAAMMAGKEEDAFLFAQKIADAGITQSSSGVTYNSIYQWLAFYYKKQKDGDNLLKYAGLGMNGYTNDPYFNLILIDWYRQQQDYTYLFAQYDQLFAKQPGSKYQLAYLNDVFGYLYSSKATVNNNPGYQDILSRGLKDYLKTNSASTEARLLLAKFYINLAMQKQAANKNSAQQLLMRSNIYLKEITVHFCSTAPKDCKEAKLLQAKNAGTIKALQAR